MSFRYPAGLITASSPVNANYPSGVWTPRQALPYLQNNVWGQDPFFDQTVLLLHGDGTNGAQNNTFLDSSSNNFTITRNGNTTQGTFTPFSLAAGEWSNYFDGSSDYLTIPDNAAFEFGTGNFTVEMWCNISNLSANPFIFSQWESSSGSDTNSSFLIYTSSSKFVAQVGYGNSISQLVLTGTTTLSNGVWYHVALVRNGSSVTLYVNGVQEATSTTISTSTVNNSNLSVIIGARTGNTSPFAGYVSNARIVKGRAVYTSAFTPPTAPLGATSGGANPPQGTETSLLTCQSNRFVDNGGLVTPNTITRNGDVRVTPFSPFQPLLAYSPGVTGGSGYFDGTGDWLSIADNAAFQYGSGNFTIEAWIYRTNSGADQQIIGSHEAGLAASWLLYVTNTNKLRMLVNNSTFAESAGTIPVNAWTHIVGIRDGNNLYVYINGVQDGSVAFSTTINSNAYAITIAADQNGDETNYSGYIASLRIIKGQALTTGAFTPPTAPVTTSAVGWTGANVAASITGTVSLLCNFTNAGILDNTAKNVLETVGNAQIDTAVVKYGTGSMEFDGTGDWLFARYNPELELGSGDFTIECWVYFTVLPSNAAATIVSYGDSDNTPRWLLYYDSRTGSANGLRFSVINGAGSAIVLVEGGGTSGWASGTWYHVAVTRSGNNWQLFRDGVQTGSTLTDSDAIPVASNNGLVIGAEPNGTVTLNGFIDDLRITKGIARYTANFVPPIARFPNQ